MAKYMKTEEGYKEIAEIVLDNSAQPNWNQNDETKKDYVKGRTHWAEIKPVVEKVNIITDASYKYDSQGCYKINGTFVCQYPQNIELTDGTPITITIETESFTGQLSAETANPDILDFSLRGQQVNGYKVPSAWYFDIQQHSFTIYGEGSSNNPAMSFSITAEIEQEREVVHTLAPKYIKDMYYSEIREDVIGTGANGWIKVTNYQAITIPKMAIKGTIYENVPVDHVANRYVYYVVGGYTLKFDRMSSSMNANGLSDNDVVFYGETQIYHKIPNEYIPDWVASVDFEARLFPDNSIPNKLNLESGIVVGDLIRAFDEGRHVIAHVCADEDDDGTPFEMQRYYVDGSSGVPYRIVFAPCSISGLQSGGAIDSLSTVVIEFIEGNWYFSGFSLDAIGGAASETPYTIPFEVNAMCCNTFAELVSATQDFHWRAYIYKGDHKLYLQIPEYTSSVTPNILYFTGITEPDDTRMSRCVWTTIKIPVSSSNVILWDDSTLPTSNTALDTWGYYKLNKDQSGILRVYNVFNEKIDLGLVDKGVIEYQGHQYLFNNVDGALLNFYCMDFNNTSKPKISTIQLNRSTTTVTVTDFHPLWEERPTDISLGLTSASVGQIIKVKSVDNTGKPTEWEAVDIPSAVTDDHINSLIDAKLEAIKNGS